jgi:F-type H+-transporting ATPase subunit delta
MRISLVAERYANALFELAVEKNIAEEIYQDALTVSEICQQSRELRMFFKAPIVHTDLKIKVVKEIFGKVVGQVMLTFLLVMIRKKREKFIPEIAGQVVENYKEYKNILTVHFRAPVLPDNDNRKKVLDLMTCYTKANIDLVEEIDSSLIGGFVLNWKDLQYDASIRKQIEKMKRGVAKVNLYVKGY